MFALARKNRDGFDIIELENTISKTSLEITPISGALLHSFRIFQNNKCINVIDSYNSLGDFANNLTSSGFKSCKLSPFACRIKNAAYTFKGEKYKLDKFLLGKNAIHGLIYDKAFTVVSTMANEKAAEVVLKYEYRGEENGYPFHFDCIVSYRLGENNRLTVKTTVTNKANVDIPIQDGGHPYFTLGKKVDELELMVKTKKKVVFDEEIIPTGELVDFTEFVNGKKVGDIQLDDCFLLDETASQPLCILKDVENGIQIEIEPDSSYPYLQLYTPPHRNSIAIENLSAPPDTFNNGIDLIILGPSESKTFTTSFTIKSIK